MDAYQIARRRSFSRYVGPQARGVEIGPSYRPTFPKAEGFHVTVVDHCPTDELRAKYAADGNVPSTLVEQIEEVDIVWHGGGYRDLAGMPQAVDFVIASHVIEHVVDVCGFLKDCSGLLREGGVLLLAIPLRRCIMDCYRPASTLGDILLAHVMPWAYEVKSRLDEAWFHSLLGSGGAWAIEDLRAAARAGRMPMPLQSVDAAGDVWRQTVADPPTESKPYRDAHRWVFDPETFEEIATFLSIFADTGLLLESQPGGHDCEFHAVLRKQVVDVNQLASLDALRRQTLVERLSPSFDLSEKPTLARLFWGRR